MRSPLAPEQVYEYLQTTSPPRAAAKGRRSGRGVDHSPSLGRGVLRTHLTRRLTRSGGARLAPRAKVRPSSPPPSLGVPSLQRLKRSPSARCPASRQRRLGKRLAAALGVAVPAELDEG